MSSVKGFGARGDGETDDTDAILHALHDGDGAIRFTRGTYKISRTIEIPLAKTGPISIDGNGTARIVMTGAGPAFRIVGTHRGTGHPTSVKPEVWPQCLPTLKNLVIEGAHPEADGVEMIETMQAVFEGLLIRRVRHGIRLHKRNRNVLISHCHVYYNTGVGIFLDAVNLHQINIASNHISYNRLGGIRISDSEVRNLQITGNDIEYNTHVVHKTKPERTAEILIDTRGNGASVNEVTIASNTIQATVTPDGANIRIIEARDASRPPGLWSITGNIIGNQEHNIHLLGCHGVVISGNCIYSCGVRNLLIEDSDHITIGANSFRRHTPALHTGIRLANSANVALSGCTLQDEAPEGQKTQASLLEMENCERVAINGCMFLDGVPVGLDMVNCSTVNMTGCVVMDTRETQRAQAMMRMRGKGRANLLMGNTFGKCEAGEALQIEADVDVSRAGNVLDA